MYWILTVGMILYVAMVVLFTALPARKRHWSMAIVRTFIILVSAIVAVPASKLISSIFTTQLYAWLKPLLPGDLLKFMGEVTVVEDSVQLIVTLLAAPMVFFLLFVVLRAILSLVLLIVEACIPGCKKKKDGKNAAVAIPLGAINGVLVAIITLVPLCGYLTMASSAVGAFGGALSADQTPVQNEMTVDGLTYDNLSAEDRAPATATTGDKWLKDLLKAASNANEDPMVNVMNTAGGPLLDWMTTGELEAGGKEISFTLSQELPHLAESAGDLAHAVTLLEDKHVSPSDKDALLGAMDGLLSSDWVAVVTADSLGYISNTWLAGESFMGMPAPEVGEMLQPMMDMALTVLSTENVDTLRADVNTVADVLTDLMAAGLLEENPDYDKLMAKMGDGFLSDLMGKLTANPHMAPLAEEVQTLTVRVVSSVLGDALKNSDKYDGLIDQFATQLDSVLEMDKGERSVLLQDTVKQIFAQYDVDVPPEVVIELSEKAIVELGADGKIEADELKQFLIDHSSELDFAGDILDDVIT